MVNTSTSCTVQKRRRQTCDTSSVLRKGSWTAEEDELLKKCVQTFGEGKWHLIPLRAGLNRCRKSCRLRWLNYLKPGIRRGEFDEYEVDLVLRIHKLLGNRWALIAGRIPGRTANDVKNYWNTHLKSHSKQKKQEVKQIGEPMARVIKPVPCTLSKSLNLQTNITAYPIRNNLITSSNDGIDSGFTFSPGLAPPQSVSDDKINEYINKLLDVEKEADDEVGWPFHGFSAQGLRVEGVIGEQDGQNNLLDFPVEEADIWDLLASEQL